MQELLLSTGSKAAYYPDSGPGSKKLLNGTTALGYFGVVTSSDLFTPAEMTVFANFTLGTAVTGITNLEWLKFFWGGRILYVPKKILWSSATWEHVYGKGLIYGIRGVGKYPYPTANPVSQYRLIVKEEVNKNWGFKVRVPSVYPTDPAAVFSSSALGEFYSLLSRVLTTPNGTGEWASFSAAELDASTLFMGQESGSAATTSNVVSLINTTPNQIPKNQGSNNNWRPVLELIDLTQETISVVRIIGDYTGVKPPRTILTADNTNIIRTVKQISFATTKLQVPKPTISYFEKLTPIRVRNWATSVLKTPVVSLTKV